MCCLLARRRRAARRHGHRRFELAARRGAWSVGERRGRRQRSRSRDPGGARSIPRQGVARPPSRPAWRRHHHPRPLGGIAAAPQPVRRSALSSTFRHTDFEEGDEVAGPIVLVCAHGRRDACCARLGPPLFDALKPQLSAGPALAVLAPRRPSLRAQRGRAPLRDPARPHPARPSSRRSSTSSRRAGSRSISIAAGRSTHHPCRQRSSRCARSTGADGVGDLRLVAHDDDLVTFATPAGELTVRVEERHGPRVPASCGAEPEPTVGVG